MSPRTRRTRLAISARRRANRDSASHSAPTFASRIGVIWTRASSIATAVGAVLGLVVLFSGIHTSITRPTIELADFRVPKTYADRGLTSEAFVMRLRSEMETIFRKAASTRTSTEISLPDPNLQVTFPGSPLSAGAIADHLAVWTGSNVKWSVTGNFIFDGNRFEAWYETSNNGHVTFSHIEATSFDALISNIARDLIGHAAPFFLAASLAQDDPDAAETIARKLLNETKDETEHVWALNLMGNIQFLAGRYEEALRRYDEALRRIASFAPALNGRGAAHYKLGHIDDAKTGFRTAITTDPKYAPAYAGLAQIADDEENLDEAVFLYKNSIDCDNQYTNSLIGLASIYRRQKKFDESVKLYDQILRQNPRNSYAHNGRGNTLLGANRDDEAKRAYEEAIHLDSKMASPHNGMGEIHMRQGRPDAAESEYRLAHELDAKEPIYLCNLVLLFERTEQLQKASDIRREIDAGGIVCRKH